MKLPGEDVDWELAEERFEEACDCVRVVVLGAAEELHIALCNSSQHTVFDK